MSTTLRSMIIGLMAASTLVGCGGREPGNDYWVDYGVDKKISVAVNAKKTVLPKSGYRPAPTQPVGRRVGDKLINPNAPVVAPAPAEEEQLPEAPKAEAAKPAADSAAKAAEASAATSAAAPAEVAPKAGAAALPGSLKFSANLEGASVAQVKLILTPSDDPLRQNTTVLKGEDLRSGVASWTQDNLKPGSYSLMVLATGTDGAELAHNTMPVAIEAGKQKEISL